MRNLAFILSCLSVFLFLGACQGEPSKHQAFDTLYVNGTIWTGVEGAGDAGVIGVKDGQIAYAGDTKPDGEAAETIDLDGKFLMAGFMDNHVHFMEGGAALSSVDLRDAASKDEFIKRIADHAENLPKDRWILNGNWDETLWKDLGGKTLPHKDWIDKVTPDIPVLVIRMDGHMALANSAALKAAGVTRDTYVPEGSEILRDDKGELTGILKGEALGLVLIKIPLFSDEELLDQFDAAQAHALSLGVTKVHAVTAYPSETEMLNIFQMAYDKGHMKIRAQVSTPIESWQYMVNEKELGGETEKLSWGGIKGFVDGSLGSRTAWMYEPYTDDPSTTGLPPRNADILGNWMADADAAGLELSIHAIGDRGIDKVMEFMKEIGGKDLREKRFRIEHFQHPSADAIKTLGGSGIIASVHPYHAIDDGRWAVERIGPERLKTTYPFRSILDAGGIMTFGSDWPVAPLSPMDGVYAAVTRRTLDGKNPGGWIPEQKISVVEALTAYTVTNAYSFGEEDVAGTLEAGKRADFVILSDDPRSVAPESLRDIRVERTVIDGKTVYERDTP